MFIFIVCSEYNCTSRRFTFQIIQFHNLSPIIGLETNNFEQFRIKTQTVESETIKVHHLKIYLLVKREQCVFSCNMQLQKIKNEKIIKLTVNTGQVMFSGEIYYY